MEAHQRLEPKVFYRNLHFMVADFLCKVRSAYATDRKLPYHKREESKQMTGKMLPPQDLI